MAKQRCKGKTKKGKPCRAHPLHDSDLCLAHSDAETRRSVQFVGGQPGSGRPRLARAHEVLRERIEADIGKWLAPYEDALGAMVEEERDHRARMQASREVLDRVYGKPAQAVELSGPEGGPVAAEIVTADAKEVADAAHEFLARLAGSNG